MQSWSNSVGIHCGSESHRTENLLAVLIGICRLKLDGFGFDFLHRHCQKGKLFPLLFLVFQSKITELSQTFRNCFFRLVQPRSRFNHAFFSSQRYDNCEKFFWQWLKFYLKCSTSRYFTYVSLSSSSFHLADRMET